MKADLERNCNVENKGLNMVIKEIKHRMKGKTTKLQKYGKRNTQILQNRLFQTNQKLFFEKIEGKHKQNDVKPSAEESRKIRSKIWSEVLNVSAQ